MRVLSEFFESIGEDGDEDYEHKEEDDEHIKFLFF
jgi:hypothetical protein